MLPSIIQMPSSWDIIVIIKGINVSLLIFVGILYLLKSFFESIPYVTIHSNDDICCHIFTIVNIPSSPPNDLFITWDAFRVALQVYQHCSWSIEILVQDPF